MLKPQTWLPKKSTRGLITAGSGPIFSEKFSTCCCGSTRGSTRAAWCDTVTGEAYS